MFGYRYIVYGLEVYPLGDLPRTIELGVCYLLLGEVCIKTLEKLTPLLKQV